MGCIETEKKMIGEHNDVIKNCNSNILACGGGGASGRNIGIDALRLLAMFYVVVLHVLGQGGVLESTAGIKNDVAWLLEIIAYCAVDVYAIVSGYVGYTDEYRPFKSSKYLSMWLQVFCYSFGVTFIAFLLKHQSVGWKQLVISAFPVATNQYWYFTAFTAVFLLKPWINRFVRNMSRKELTVFSLLVFCLFSIYSIFAGRLGGDPLNLAGGYCVLWLIMLYIVGAWLKKCNIVNAVGKKHTIIIIIVCTLIMWIARQFVPSVIGAGILVSYVSPTVLLSAIAYVVLFSKVKPPKVISGLIVFLAPAAFGVYLVHCQSIVWGHFLENAFGWIGGCSVWAVPFLVLASALIIFTCCILIEKARLLMFKLLKIDALVNHFGAAADSLLICIENKADCFVEKINN